MKKNLLIARIAVMVIGILVGVLLLEDGTVLKGKDGKPITLTTDKYEVAINDAVGNNWKKAVMGEDYNDFRDALIADIKNEDPITASNWLKSEAATQRGIADAKGPTADKAARKARIYTDIANKIENELEYPGQIKVNVIRELRTVEYAK